jgi:hypothetical protein
VKINNNYSIGQKLKVKVDGGDAEAEVVALTYRLNHGGQEFFNYELNAYWFGIGQNGKNQKFERQIIRTQEELETTQTITSEERGDE